MKKRISILAISGSLRSNSSNNAVLNIAAEAAPANVDFHIYEDLASIPAFDDSKSPAEAVMDFRSQLKSADGIMICSPEYAFGVPGSLKNALDWTVSTGEFVNKPTALITAATGGDKAHAALLLTFTALSATISEESKLLIPFVRSKMNAAGLIVEEQTISNIQAVLKSLIRTIEEKTAE